MTPMYDAWEDIANDELRRQLALQSVGMGDPARGPINELPMGGKMPDRIPGGDTPSPFTTALGQQMRGGLPGMGPAGGVARTLMGGVAIGPQPDRPVRMTGGLADSPAFDNQWQQALQQIPMDSTMPMGRAEMISRTNPQANPFWEAWRNQSGGNAPTFQSPGAVADRPAPTIRNDGPAYRDNQGLWDSMNVSANMRAWDQMSPQRMLQDYMHRQQMATMDRQNQHQVALQDKQLAGQKEIAKIQFGKVEQPEKVAKRMDARRIMADPKASPSMKAEAKRMLLDSGESEQDIKMYEQGAIEARFAPKEGQAFDINTMLDELSQRNPSPQDLAAAAERLSTERYGSERLQRLVRTLMAEGNFGQVDIPGGTVKYNPVERWWALTPFGREGGTSGTNWNTALNHINPLYNIGATELDKQLNEDHYNRLRRKIESASQLYNEMQRRNLP